MISIKRDTRRVPNSLGSFSISLKFVLTVIWQDLGSSAKSGRKEGLEALEELEKSSL